MDQLLTNMTSSHEEDGSIPGLTQQVKDLALPMSCGVGHRRSLDPELLWLWIRPAATALIQPLAWELPYAEGAAPEKAKRQKDKKKKKKKKRKKPGGWKEGKSPGPALESSSVYEVCSSCPFFLPQFWMWPFVFLFFFLFFF